MFRSFAIAVLALAIMTMMNIIRVQYSKPVSPTEQPEEHMRLRDVMPPEFPRINDCPNAMHRSLRQQLQIVNETLSATPLDSYTLMRQ